MLLGFRIVPQRVTSAWPKLTAGCMNMVLPCSAIAFAENLIAFDPTLSEGKKDDSLASMLTGGRHYLTFQ